MTKNGLLVNDEQFFPPPEADPPPWIVSRPPPAGQPPPDRGGPGRLVLAAVAVVVVLVAAAGGAWWLFRPEDEAPPVAATSAPTVDEPAPPPADEPPPPPTADPTPVEPPATLDPEAEALAQLDEISRRDLTGVRLDGRHVAQLASKNPGIPDPLQTTAAGSHVFAATDILDEHRRLRDDPANGDVRVVLLKSTDYGRAQTRNGAPLYVTFALGDFAGPDDIRSWCRERFPDLTAEQRENQCAPRRLRPLSP